MSKELIKRLRFDASVSVNGTAMTAAENLVEAADALEIATAGIDAYTKELGSCRKAAGFGSANDPIAQEGFDALGDPLCVAAFVESQFKRIVAERDSLAAELKALREQEPIGVVDEGDDGVFADLETTNGVLVRLGDKLYARPVPARRLTDEEIGKIYIKAVVRVQLAARREIAFARAIETALFGGELQPAEAGHEND